MEVVRYYDIARMVLGYLRDNNLEKAAKIFCKTSPHLQEERELLKKGYWPVSLHFGQLSDIIREYYEIQSIVLQSSDSLAISEKEGISKRSTLLAKVSFLVKAAKRGLTTCESMLGKRRNDEESADTSLETTQEKDLPGYSPPASKRRRLSQSFLCLASNRVGTVEETSDDDGSVAQQSSGRTSESGAGQNSDPIAASARKKDPVPSFPEIAEFLVGNTDFQNKLADNINKVLAQTATIPATATEKIPEASNSVETVRCSDDIGVQFEEMIKNILNETEKDPTFNEVVENIVLSNNAVNEQRVTSDQSTQYSPPPPAVAVASTKPPCTTIKDRLRSRKGNTPIQRKVNSPSSKLCPVTPTNDNAVIGSNTTELNACHSNFVMMNPNDAITTSTPVISDSFNETALIDIATGQSIPFFVSSDMNSIFLMDMTDDAITDRVMLSEMNAQTSDALRLLLEGGRNVTEVKIVPGGVIHEGIKVIPDGAKVVANETAKTISDVSKVLSEDPRIVSEVTRSGPETILSDQTRAAAETGKTTADATKSTSTVKTKFIKIQSNHKGKFHLVTASLSPQQEIQDACTPSDGITNYEENRCQSTPRRKSSHVRVLNFKTPSKGQSIMPVVPKESELPKGQSIMPFLSNLSDFPKPRGEFDPANVMVQIIEQPPPSAPPPVAQQEKVPIVVSKEPGTVTNNLTVVNESSNCSSNSFGKATSDVTVIRQSIGETPKRKIQGRRSCARVLSHSGSEETAKSPKEKKNPKSLRKVKVTPKKSPGKTKIRKKEKTITKDEPQRNESETKKPAEPEDLDPMTAWKNMRSIAPGQWDQHLRTVSAKLPPVPQQRSARKKRRKLLAERRKAKKLAAESSMIADESDTNTIDSPDSKTTSADATSSTRQSTKKSLINFKIVTPIKAGKSSVKNRKIEIVMEQNNEVTSTKVDGKSGESEPVAEVEVEAGSTVSQVVVEPSKLPQTVLDNRSTNISLLLDTPLKSDATAIPITPRFLVPGSNDTPFLKLPTSFRGQISMCKNPDLPTPLHAITPGAGLTPLDKDTPRSGCWSTHLTDYSSGGSYYKPDESEDLDKHLDSMLKAERKQSVTKKPSLNPPVTRDSSYNEESSNQTGITAIHKQIEVQEIVTIVPSEDKETPAGESVETNCSKDQNESTSSSSSSSSCSSCSSSSSDSHSNDDDSWVQPEEIAKENTKLLTPKKKQSMSPDKVGGKSLDEVVNKIKNKKLPEPMKTKQLDDLKEKRLRVQSKLKKDFSANDVKRLTSMYPKKIRILSAAGKSVRPPATTVVPATPIKATAPVIGEEQIMPISKIDVLAALQLSEKKRAISPSTQTIAQDCFEDVDFPKLRLDEDSKDSADTLEVRNAAFVLTKLSKRKTDEETFVTVPKIEKKPANKGRQKKPTAQATTRKPVTRRDSKNLLATTSQTETNVTARNEANQRISPVVMLHDFRTTKKIATIQEQGTKSMEPAVEKTSPHLPTPTPTPITFQTSPSGSLECISSEQEEDEDSYDECEPISIGEDDKAHYFHLIHDTSRQQHKPKMPSYREMREALSSVMKVNLNGAWHQIATIEEVELFTNMPMMKTVKAAKTTMSVQSTEKESRKAVASKRKQPAIRKKKQQHEEEPDDSKEPEAALAKIQPKINIKYKGSKTSKTKSKTTSVLENITERDYNSVTAENVATTSTGLQAITSAPTVKNEDIYAVLSHLYGQE